SPMVTDLMGGQIDLAFATLPSVAPLLQSGKLRALAVTSPKRSPLLAEVPTFVEVGVAGYQAEFWYAIFAPAATPTEVVKRLHAAFKRAAETEEFRKRAVGEGLLVTLDGPEDTARVFRDDVAKWRKVIIAQSIKME
ncbi:MAG TPA: tripartite tricarboxylate transporter substrate-binding protein, partial [Burkholderiaceae bacterium]|nr:tripartite tricarboxylate transporter substrate-binding protein [Burkholderiaceae bacterium]